jgi:hypothetical protein
MIVQDRVKEDGASVTAGIADSGSQTDISKYAPKNMIKLVDPSGALQERLNAAKQRWGTTLQERVKSAQARWLVEERTNISRIEKIEDHEGATDYEKERTKTINANLKAEADDFEQTQDSRLIKDADLRDANYVDNMVDDFLEEYFGEK